ncbi:MAG TPA: hypothetical protein VLU99_08335 [Nitrososphaerales archaeon]|nr:hypothetical protein [Nitrososphaerales archaeon]HUK75786.1 hypothetical protein [Nitrososphaerales archaeon]
MPQEPMSLFGWLMGCCVSEDGPSRSKDAVSAAVVFASGVVASGVTMYLAGLAHLI